MEFSDVGISLPFGARGDIKTFCPQCRDARNHAHRSDRPLSVNVEEGVWNCHNCGWGDSLKAVQKREQGAFNPAPVRQKPEVPQPLTGHALVFLKERGMDPGILAEKYHIYGDDGGIHLPYYDKGEWLNTKHRYFSQVNGTWNDKASHSVEAGRPLTFWNLDACRGQETIAITEGEWDAIVINEVGIPAMSVPNGASKGSMKLDYLASGQDIIEHATRILICVDTDDAGRSLEQELVRRIGPEKCLRVEWSTGKDANDVFKTLGVDGLLHDLNHPVFYPIEGLIRPTELVEQLKQLYHEGAPRGFSTGMATVDPLLTIMPGAVYLVTGIPGAGKSEWLDQVVINTVHNLDWRWTIFSPEGDPREEHLSRLIEKLTHAPFFDGPTPRVTWPTARAAVTFLEQYVSFIDPDEPTPDAILTAAKSEHLRRGLNALVIDPWNEVITEAGGNVSEYLSRVLREIRRWAARSGVAIFIVNHPHALQLDKETKEYPIVRHYDLNNGAMWANKMSGIISIWRSRKDHGKPVEVNIIKAKTRRIGRTGKAELYYNTVTGEYTSPVPKEGDTYVFLG